MWCEQKCAPLPGSDVRLLWLGREHARLEQGLVVAHEVHRAKLGRGPRRRIEDGDVKLPRLQLQQRLLHMLGGGPDPPSAFTTC